MYYYIVDPQKISQKEFERVQNVLYSSLSEYRISGEVVRVTGLRTVQQLVENALAHEAKTIVAVGSDETLNTVINAVNKREVVIGFIPIVESEIGNILGMKDITQAVKTIASRRIQDLDLGVINGNYFLSKISFGQTNQNGWGNLFNLPTFEIKFSVNEEYHASQKVVGGIIINSRHNRGELKNIGLPATASRALQAGNPTDSLLDVLLLAELSKWHAIRFRSRILAGFYENIPQASLVHVKKIEILQPAGLPLKIGEVTIAKTPAIITIAPAAVRMIVAKERNF
jgi:diacylglycerol kinase family enzyme